MLYIDVDAMVKLAHWKVLPQLPILLSTSWEKMATVSSLRYRAQRCVESPDLKLFHNKEAAISVVTAINKMAAPDSEIDESLLSELEKARAIDAGEAVLLSFVAKSKSSKFLTGDKRAIRALSNIPVAKTFIGKVVTIEQVLLICLVNKGRDWIRNRLCPYRELDKSIKVILGSQCDNDLQSINEALNSYINEIHRLYNPSLLSELPFSNLY